MPGLFGGMGDAKSKPSSDASESEEAAQDVLDAISDGDARALDLALQRHYEICQGADHESDEGDEDEATYGED